MLLARRAAAVLAPLALLVAGAAPAGSHLADPQVVTVLDGVAPALPAGVVVQVQEGIAAQLVVANPTATELQVLGRGGAAFLRISSAGVLADLGSPDFYETSSPSGAGRSVPVASRGRFVPISSGTSWGWYDHRLHPRAFTAADGPAGIERLAEFAIPLRYGRTAVTVRGHVERRPLRGTFHVTADLAPEALSGVTVQVLQSSKLPGLFLSNTTQRSFTILGRDGEPFARFGPRGLEVNEASRTRVEARQARGDRGATPGLVPRFALLGGGSLSWLDVRLRYPSAAPPAEAPRRGPGPRGAGRGRGAGRDGADDRGTSYGRRASGR